MKQSFQIILSIFFLSIFSNLYSQENEPSKNGEITLSEKIAKYKPIDSLDRNDPMNAYKKQIILDFEVSRMEGSIEVENLKKHIYGDGGFSIYNFIDIKQKKNLKMEYNITTHIYKDINLKNYRNTEIRNITIFFDENDKPDLVKITENQYDEKKVLSSALYFINMPQANDNYQNSSTKSLINEVFQIVKNYKK